jgi:mRNA-degrading endonuclease RelE of RelBE toxin-antitoxin system
MRRTITFRDEAKRDVRMIDRENAMRILFAISRFASGGEGDVKRLQDVNLPELRLRVGDYRVRFYDSEEAILVLAVKHRREAYR